MSVEEQRQRVEPVECAANHDPVEMYEKEAFGTAVTYECPTCGRVIELDFFGSEVEREVLDEGNLC
ncbi:hypothetical protein [Halosimplex salinum]|uniref:hypothetical protein n=1 Tax=Halosimplex salinum TaxID=1710538 RepID=UPI000F48D37F|nr:hypothetical protein [Halosimplex salinum]